MMTYSIAKIFESNKSAARIRRIPAIKAVLWEI